MRSALLTFVLAGIASAIVLSASHGKAQGLLGQDPASAVPSTTAATASAVPSVVSTPVPGFTPVDDEGNPLPPTFAPATTTPKLPEEGGPPGGVLGGHLYVDVDRDRTQSAADTPVAFGQVFIQILDNENVLPPEDQGNADANGYWEIRGLPDARYRVSWGPPLRDPTLLSQTIPPAETFAITPDRSITAVTRMVEIRGANRILDIDFGMPLEPPVAGPHVMLPDTGAGDAGDSPWLAAAFFGAAIALGLGAAATVRRRVW